MVTIDPLRTVLDLIFLKTGKLVTADEYELSEPIARLGDYNTEVILYPKLRGKHYARHSFKYNRIDIGEFSPIAVNNITVSKVSDLLADINDAASFALSVSFSNEERVVVFTSPPLKQNDIIDRVLTNFDTNGFYLQTNPNSYLFIGIARVDNVALTAKPPTFISFDLDEDLRTLGIVNLGISPTQTMKDETVTVSFNARGLAPGIRYVGHLYYQTGPDRFTGSIFYRSPGIITGSAGMLTFSQKVVVPVVIDQTKVFLLLVPSGVVVPDSVIAGQDYQQVATSQEQITLTASDPNTYYTSSLFGILLEDSLSIELSSPDRSLLIPVNVEMFRPGLASVEEMTLVETIVFKTANVTDSSLKLQTTAIESATLEETIVYKSATQSEANTLVTNKATIESATLTVVINYVSYNNVETSKIKTNLATIESGTLS
jgi:hypothetical protein